MKHVLSLLAAAVTALILLPHGSAHAGDHLASRLGQSDAHKLARQRADAERWLDEHDGTRDPSRRERHRLLCEDAWRAASASLGVDCGRFGGVIVTGWGRDSIRVIARVEALASDPDRARSLARGVRIVNEGGKLTAEGPDDGEGESWSVTFDVLVPRDMALQLDAQNGPVCVADVNSRMDLRTVNGPLALSGLAGDVRARTRNGPLSVSLAGTHWRGAGLDASTQNGPVVLAVPRGYSCTLETGTINGPMSMGLPIVIQGRTSIGRQHVSTKLGHGGALVRAITTNGPAVVRYVGERKGQDEGEGIEF